ncbi:MAG: inositol monophosphatase family protein [Anaerolineae bacterium]|nr:inositol monophosphatase family protein [Anaerolineae bacterium]
MINDEFLQTAIEAARVAGQIMCEQLHQAHQVRHKGPRDLVTEVDLMTEASIVHILHARFPDHDILTEEAETPPRRSRYCWVIDPLDGTNNYAHGYPIFSTSVALTLDDEPLVGVVYEPLRDWLFHAQRGDGAYLNGERLHVSTVEQLGQALITLDWSTELETRTRVIAAVERLAGSVTTMRVAGSAALAPCYLAAGWCDGYFHLGLKPWDAAAAVLIAREAGGQATTLEGRPWRLEDPACVVSNGLIHEPLRALIQHVGQV